MEKFYENIATIMEVDKCTQNDKLKDFDSWDSLAVLSILAMAQTEYKCHLSKDDLDSIVTVGELEKLLISRKNV